jgi:N-acetylglutamate synthase-like GNAT family acetyltransferase
MTSTVRRAGLDDEGAAWDVVDEYNRSIGVVVTDDAASFRAYLAGPGALWLAYDGDVVGCVALRPLRTAGPHAAEVKRLYVRPAYRGSGVAAALMDALEVGAQDNGYSELYLDTKDDLADAIRFYERRGYERVPRYNDNPQATIFMRRALQPAG